MQAAKGHKTWPAENSGEMRAITDGKEMKAAGLKDKGAVRSGGSVQR